MGRIFNIILGIALGVSALSYMSMTGGFSLGLFSILLSLGIFSPLISIAVGLLIWVGAPRKASGKRSGKFITLAWIIILLAVYQGIELFIPGLIGFSGFGFWFSLVHLIIALFLILGIGSKADASAQSAGLAGRP